MKQLIARTLTSLMLTVMVLAVTAHAQSKPTIKVSIPFSFAFGDKTFPAGDYSLKEAIPGFLVLRDSREKVIAGAFAEGMDSPAGLATTKLRFYSAGGQYILREVLRPQDSASQMIYSAGHRTKVDKHPSDETRETAAGGQP